MKTVSVKIKRQQDLITKLIQAKKVYLTMYGLNKRKDTIMNIHTSEISNFVLNWDGEPAFIYIWGWPGPDFNVYKMSDYGETWAFTEKELIV